MKKTFFDCVIDRSVISIAPVPMFETVIVSNFETVLHDERRKSREDLFTLIVADEPFALIGMHIVSEHGSDVRMHRLARTVSVFDGEKRTFNERMFPAAS